MTHSLCIKQISGRLLVLWASCLCMLCGCTSEPPVSPPTGDQQTSVLPSTFRGKTSTGQPVRITLNQKGNTVTGNGLIGDRFCSLSGITAYHGPIIITFEDGSVTPATVALSPDGETATIQGLKQPLIVSRGGEPVDASTGPFAGKYRASGKPPLTLNLIQAGKLLSGTGFVNGKPVAVAGKITGSNQVSGFILFSDESRNAVKAMLSGDGRILTVRGLGNPIEMKKE
ncbi:MAG: hypothetical protein ACYDGO_09675 [Smithellaceae bacterium]